MAQQPDHRPPDPMPTTQDLALERTRLALERTMMGWMRTAVSMIGFGFTIFKFFQYMRESGQAPVRPVLISSQDLALMLVGSSTVLLVLAMIQYRHTMAWLTRHGSRQMTDTVMVGAGLIVVIGMITFGAIALTRIT